MALALVLLVGAGLMTRSFQRLLQVSPGFDGANVLAARVLLPTTKYRERPALSRFYDDVLERLRRAPGVRNASAVSALPLQNVGAASSLPFTVAGQAPPEAEDPMSEVRIVAPGYFETMRIPLLEGRYLDERDAETGPRTTVINQTMARRYFPGRSPLGQIVQNPHGRAEVVGVVGDVRNEGLESEPKKQVYLPMRQSPSAGMALVARTEGDPAALAMTLQRVIWDVDPQQPIYELSTANQLLARAVFLPRLSTSLLALFALAALLLAVLGIYGVLSIRERALEGDRPPAGTRRDRRRHGDDGAAAECGHGGHGRRDRSGGVGVPGPVARRRALRRGPVRPAVVRRRRRRAAHGRRHRQRAAGPADDTRRSRDRAARVVAVRRPGRHAPGAGRAGGPGAFSSHVLRRPVLEHGVSAAGSHRGPGAGRERAGLHARPSTA
ncbi:MAG: ABC transporter permease [Vicinamibacterales bacterium]